MSSIGTSSRIFEALRQDIVQLHLRPGHLLSEWEVAKQFNVSRQPVREAFIKLGEVGLVEIRPKRGTFVRLISMREIDNARFIRGAIEVALVRQAALLAEKKDIEALLAVLDGHRILIDRDDYTGLLLHDELFHRTISHIAQREDAWSVINSLKAQVDRARFLTLPNVQSILVILEQHEKIVQAISNNDPEEAERSMLNHLREIQNFLPLLRKEHPDLFTD